MNFVDDISNFYKWYSMQGMAIIGIIQGSWLMVPDVWKEGWLVDTNVTVATLVFVVLTAIGRIKAQ